MELNFDNLIKCITELCAIESVCDKPEPGAPFGKGVRDALRYTLAVSKELGFNTSDLDGYCGTATVGEGREFGILTHLDVVPAGEGWDTPPFKPTQKDGKLYARGVLDDKAATMVCLFATAELMKTESPRRKIRFIFGLDEESGSWECLEHYRSVMPLPEEGFSPDADFPVVNSEKGILHLSLLYPAPDTLREFEGGDRLNVVADRAFLTVGNERFSFRGKRAHASQPELGENAIAKAIVFLQSRYTTLTPLLRLIDPTGKAAGIACEDESGRLTLSPGTVAIRDGNIELGTDIRYPVTEKPENLICSLEKCGFSVKLIQDQKPLFVAPDSNLVTDLLSAYESVMGSAKPLQIGGGTFARALKEGVAFGPLFPDEVSTCHQANENISIENLHKMYDIYKAAIRKTCF